MLCRTGHITSVSPSSVCVQKASAVNTLHGPASPWSLVEFQCLNGINELWRGAAFMCRFANTEQRHPTGVLTNIQGLHRSLDTAWPEFTERDNELKHTGPLPRVRTRTCKHQPSVGSSSGAFLSASSFSLNYLFWWSLFSDIWYHGVFLLGTGM